MPSSRRPHFPVTRIDGGMLRAPVREKQWPWNATPSRFRHCMVLPKAPDWLADIPLEALQQRPRIFTPHPRARRHHTEPTPMPAPARRIELPRPQRAHRTSSAGLPPVAIGALLVVAPPLGVAAAWASRHYDRDARIALTATAALWLTLVTVVASIVLL